MHLIKQLLKKSSNWASWHTDRKLVVLISDDWGGIRVASRDSQSALSTMGIPMATNRFNRFDSLENNADMEGLFNVLTSFKDSKGNHPNFTAACTIGNPHFEKIRESEFREYHYELFPETLSRFSNTDKVFSYYQKGIAEGFFTPEFHGREHLNVPVWMRALQEPVPIVRKAFEESYFYLEPNLLPSHYQSGFGASFDLTASSDKRVYKQILADGLQQFEALFGYKSTFVIPPAQAYFDDLDTVLVQHKVSAIDKPIFSSGSKALQLLSGKQEYTGKRNNSGLMSIVRNAVFEPNMNEYNDGVDECLASIAFNFDCRVPTVISNHRAAFVGGIDKNNRSEGLKALEHLLTEILKKWPEVEFVSASQLQNIINESEQ
jgi:hypothetical protein